MSLQLSEPRAEGEEPLKIWNCVNCRRRKLRCDRRHPCAPCMKSKIDCIFPVSGRMPSRSRVGDRAAQKQVELVGRLRRLEAMVGGLSSQVENAAGITPNDLPLHGLTSATSETSGEQSSSISNGIFEPPQVAEDFGVLEVASNGDLVVGEGFWTVFCKEVEDIFEAVQGHTVVHFDDGSSSSMSDISLHTGYYNFLLRSTSTARQKQDIYPLPSQILFLWKIYMDNVDPFMKILHVPSMTKVIQEIRSSYDTISLSMQALVLAISLASIISLEENEVKANFHAEKIQLIAQYRLGTEQALRQADFLNTSDMTLLQALAIYLSMLQNTGETKVAWVLAGVLVRAAVSMKLHLEGSKFGNISPFDGQMRRRLWWQICLIDSKSESAQLSAFKLSENMFETGKPTNTDDASLNSSMSQPAPHSQGWTDMFVFLLRCEIWTLSRQLQSVPNVSEKLEVLKRNERKIEATYLSYLDTMQPMQAFIGTSVRLFLTKVDLMLLPKSHNNNHTQPREPTQAHKIFTLYLAVIDYTYALQNEPRWSGWRWQIQGRQPPWNALRTVLGHLSTAAWEPRYEQALASVRRSLEGLPESSRSDPRYHQFLVQLSMVETIFREHREGLGQIGNVHEDEAWPVYLDPPRQIANSSVDQISAEAPQGLFLDMPGYTGAEMDWQAWNDIAGDLDLWDMGNL
ncbi:hypothetical protein N431DRAFT_485055 [Stipitochalara longipes BDJ]|nr:hypothetical protein N431DRAFT_485055 [Stipitochalara longipes BDJ]